MERIQELKKEIEWYDTAIRNCKYKDHFYDAEKLEYEQAQIIRELTELEKANKEKTEQL